MAFQLFKSNDENNQPIVNNPTEEITTQYNPILVSNNVSLENAQLSSFDKSYNEDIVEETVPTTTVSAPIIQTQNNNYMNPIPPTIPNNMVQQPVNSNQPMNTVPITPNVIIEQKQVSKPKRLFPKPNTTPIRPLPNFNIPPAPNYQVETPNYQAVSNSSEPKVEDFKISTIPQIDTQVEDQVKQEIDNTVLPEKAQEIVSTSEIEIKPEEVIPTIDTVKEVKQPNIVIPVEEVQSDTSDNNESELNNYDFISSDNEESKTVNEMVKNLLVGENSNLDTNIKTEEEKEVEKETISNEEEPKTVNIIPEEYTTIPSSVTEEDQNLDDIKIDNFSSLTDDNIIKVSTEPLEEGFKRCPKCGQKMREDYKQCFVCGTYF